MHNNSFLSNLRNNIANSMRAGMFAQALYTNATTNSNVGYNTKRRETVLRVKDECIICEISKCGSDAHPESGKCIE